MRRQRRTAKHRAKPPEAVPVVVADDAKGEKAKEPEPQRAETDLTDEEIDKMLKAAYT